MEETITLLRVDTGEAVRNLADLRANIKAYKEELETLDVGTQEYADTLTALQANQAALKNAMHATTAEGDGQADAFATTAKAALGLGTSYNALVKQMADLDQQFRSTEDAAKRAQLGEQIKAINDQLKEMDEARGKFGRNVGDYFNQAKEAMKSVIQDLPSGLSVVKRGMDDVSKSMGLLSKQPILGIIALLAPLINKITDGLKDNKTALDAVKKLTDALKPVADFFAGILEKIAGWISRAVDYILELGQKSGIEFKNIVAGAVGVGNAILQFILTPIRNVIDGAKAMGNVLQQVFKGQFKEAAQTAKDAVKDIADNFRQGFDFKGNFEVGKKVGEEFAAGLKSTKRNAADAAKAVGDEAKKELLKTWDDLEKERQHREALQAEARAMAAQEQKDINAIILEDEKATTEAINTLMDEQIAKDLEAREEAEKTAQARIQALQQLAGATSSILGSIADLYDENAAQDEAAAQKAKALRTAAAVIDTISGAVSAYMGTIKAFAGQPFAIPVAAANAAAVLAAGYAQIRSINAVKVGGSSGSAGAVVQAPAFQPAVQRVRNVTGASEEERLNRMASDSRVVLVWSDAEAKMRERRVRIAEGEW